MTAAVLVLTAISAFCGRTTVSAFGRTIAPRSIMNAVTLLMAGGVLCLVGACAIAGIEDAPFHQCLFEADLRVWHGRCVHGSDTDVGGGFRALF